MLTDQNMNYDSANSRLFTLCWIFINTPVGLDILWGILHSSLNILYLILWYESFCELLCSKCSNTGTEMSSFWWNLHHWLHRKLSFWQHSMQSVMKISSKWQHFHFSEYETFSLQFYISLSFGLRKYWGSLCSECCHISWNYLFTSCSHEVAVPSVAPFTNMV